MTDRHTKDPAAKLSRLAVAMIAFGSTAVALAVFGMTMSIISSVR